MPLELGIWRVEKALIPIVHQGMDTEKRLEGLLEQDISIIAPNLMVIGRQVPTPFGKFVDLLAIDGAGNLAVIELKRDMTPREVIAQVLDYGSWVHALQAEGIAAIWQEYQEKSHPAGKGAAFDDAFCSRFQLRTVPEELNDEHQLIVVSSGLDESTERIVKYLADYHDVGINAIFFRLFRDGDREYLTRAWLRDPNDMPAEGKADSPKGRWNNEYYVSFGGGRDWGEAVKYGFIAGGGGPWYSNTLLLLSPGDRIWVNIPGSGYVGVGRVVQPRKIAEEFLAADEQGRRVPITALPLKIAAAAKQRSSVEDGEYLVGVEWTKTVGEDQAIREVGFFGNQNTVARPRTQKWVHTVERLKLRFGIEGQPVTRDQA